MYFVEERGNRRLVWDLSNPLNLEHCLNTIRLMVEGKGGLVSAIDSVSISKDEPK